MCLREVGVDVGWCRVTAVRRYGRVLRSRQVPRLVTAMVVGRLPNGMRPLGIVLLVHQQQSSYSSAGAALAALMIGTTGSAPFRGRAVDRWGQSRMLVGLSLLQAVVLAGFVAAALTRQSALVLCVLATLMGATGSTLGGSMRALWPVLVERAQDLPAAYALQALLEDLIAVIGPLAASLLLIFASPAAILVWSGLAGFAGAAVFVTAPASRSTGHQASRRPSVLGALSAPGMRVLVGTLTCTGAVIGVLNVTVPAAAQRQGMASAAGVLLAALSASSMLSGLYYGGRGWKSSLAHRCAFLAGLLAVLAVPLPAARSVGQLGGLLVLVGLAYAPSMITAYLLLDDLAPPGTLTEAYTWLVSASAGGIALGSALAGPVVEHAGIHWALALAVVSAAAGFALVMARRATLRPASVTGSRDCRPGPQGQESPG